MLPTALRVGIYVCGYVYFFPTFVRLLHLDFVRTPRTSKQSLPYGTHKGTRTTV
jgi:hypothetical protein